MSSEPVTGAHSNENYIPEYRGDNYRGSFRSSRGGGIAGGSEYNGASYRDYHDTHLRDTILGVVLAILFFGIEGAGIGMAVQTGGMTGIYIGAATGVFALGVTAFTMYGFKVRPSTTKDYLAFFLTGPAVFAFCMWNRAALARSYDDNKKYSRLF